MIHRLKDIFNINAVATYLKREGEDLMIRAPKMLGGAFVVGLAALGATATFGLSAAFAAIALATPVSFYGIGYSMKTVGRGLGSLKSG